MASKAAECDPIGDARAAGLGLKAVTLQKKRVLGTLRKTHMLRAQEDIPPEIFKHLNRALRAKTRRFELRSGGARIIDIVIGPYVVPQPSRKKAGARTKGTTPNSLAINY